MLLFLREESQLRGGILRFLLTQTLSICINSFYLSASGSPVGHRCSTSSEKEEEVWPKGRRGASSPQAGASSTQPAPHPFFGGRSCRKRSKPLLLPAALFALSASQDPPLTSVRMASLRRTRQLSCKHHLNCVHVSLQKPPRLISASIKSPWPLLRLHFLLLDHEK